MTQTPMTVKHLKELLKDIPEATEVWVSHDEEGNGFGVPTMEDGIGQDDKTLILYPILARGQEA